jgi:hypothetical protein
MLRSVPQVWGEGGGASLGQPQQIKIRGPTELTVNRGDIMCYSAQVWADCRKYEKSACTRDTRERLAITPRSPPMRRSLNRRGRVRAQSNVTLNARESGGVLCARLRSVFLLRKNGKMGRRWLIEFNYLRPV